MRVREKGIFRTRKRELQYKSQSYFVLIRSSISSAGLEYLLVPDKAENSSVLDKAENPLVADNGKNPFVPVKIDPDNDEIFLF